MLRNSTFDLLHGALGHINEGHDRPKLKGQISSLFVTINQALFHAPFTAFQQTFVFPFVARAAMHTMLNPQGSSPVHKETSPIPSPIQIPLTHYGHHSSRRA